MNPNKLNTHICRILAVLPTRMWYISLHGVHTLISRLCRNGYPYMVKDGAMNMRNSTLLAGWWIWKVRNLCKPTNSFVQCPWLLSTNDNSFGKNGWPSFGGLIRTSEGQWIAVAGEATLVYQTASMVSF